MKTKDAMKTKDKDLQVYKEVFTHASNIHQLSDFFSPELQEKYREFYSAFSKRFAELRKESSLK